MYPTDEEDVALPDGTTIVVRPIRPSDRPLFLEGMKHISPETWLYRFLMPRDHLEEKELDYLLSPDGVTHFAIGAASRSPDGAMGPVAVARYVVMEDTEHVAECAILVVDHWQGRGVGRALGERLMAAARAQGLKAFHCEILLENHRMKALLRRLAPDAHSHVVGSHAIFRVPLVPGALEEFAEPDLAPPEATELPEGSAAEADAGEKKGRMRDWASWTGRWKVRMFWRSRDEEGVAGSEGEQPGTEDEAEGESTS